MVELVKVTFEKEFNCIENKFKIFNLTINEAYKSKEEFVYHPGVYIFWHENKIIKVGRHLVNSRKRALEHIRDNTNNEEFQMNSFKSSKKNRGLILINCINPEDYHWVAAIEIYFEKTLNPVIRSKRTG